MLLIISFFLDILFGIFFSFGFGDSLSSLSGEKVCPVSVQFEFGDGALTGLDGDHDWLS